MIGKLPQGLTLIHSAILRCAPLFLGPIGAEVAWLVAMTSLPCHMGLSYLARLPGY